MRTINTLLIIALALSVAEAIAETASSEAKAPHFNANFNKEDYNLVPKGDAGSTMAAQVVKEGLPCPPEVCKPNTYSRSGYSTDTLITPAENNQPGGIKPTGGSTGNQ